MALGEYPGYNKMLGKKIMEISNIKFSKKCNDENHQVNISQKFEAQEAQLEEYRTLRQEILDIERIQYDLSIYVFTVVGVIYTITFSSENIYLLLISYVILVPLRCKHIFYHEMVTKLATYISTVLEPSIVGLRWENRTHMANADDGKFKNDFRFIQLHNYIYSIIAWGNAVLILTQSISDTSTSCGLKLLFLIFSIVMSIIVTQYDLLMICKAKKVREYYIRAWKEILLIEKSYSIHNPPATKAAEEVRE